MAKPDVDKVGTKKKNGRTVYNLKSKNKFSYLKKSLLS